MEVRIKWARVKEFRVKEVKVEGARLMFRFEGVRVIDKVQVRRTTIDGNGNFPQDC